MKVKRSFLFLFEPSSSYWLDFDRQDCSNGGGKTEDYAVVVCHLLIANHSQAALSDTQAFVATAATASAKGPTVLTLWKTKIGKQVG